MGENQVPHTPVLLVLKIVSFHSYTFIQRFTSCSMNAGHYESIHMSGVLIIYEERK